MIRLFVDADACPVRDEACRVADRHGLEVFMVCNGGIRPSADPKVHLVVVDAGADAADRWIAERVGPGDICVTADVPLAARVLAAGGAALGPTGAPFTAANMGAILALRDLASDLRAANPLGTGGGARPFGKADRSRFLDQLERLVQAQRRGR